MGDMQGAQHQMSRQQGNSAPT
jgi:hypothetical protein